MKKRQKKKEYKKITGNNPPPWIRYHGEIYHLVMQKPWGGLRAKLGKEAEEQEAARKKEISDNMKGFIEKISERNKRWKNTNPVSAWKK